MNSAEFESLININQLETSSDSVEQCIRNGFLLFDANMRNSPEVETGEDKSGSTAVCVFVTPKYFIFANCGDSRAILIRKGNVVFSTVDHKPMNPNERKRIMRAGGSVIIQRVNGSLAVSRALGDFEYKKADGRGATEQMVSAEPDVTILARHPKDDEFIILACDGIWDVMKNDEMNAFLQHKSRVTNNWVTTCNEIVDLCLYKGSRDNMSIVIVALESAPKVVPELAEKDAKLNSEIRRYVAAYLNKHPDVIVQLDAFIPDLLKLNLQNYPPGGLDSKLGIVEALIEEHNASINLRRPPNSLQKASF